MKTHFFIMQCCQLKSVNNISHHNRSLFAYLSRAWIEIEFRFHIYYQATVWNGCRTRQPVKPRAVKSLVQSDAQKNTVCAIRWKRIRECILLGIIFLWQEKPAMKLNIKLHLSLIENSGRLFSFKAAKYSLISRLGLVLTR